MYPVRVSFALTFLFLVALSNAYETFAPLATSDGDSKQGLSVTDATDQAQAITEAIQKMEDTIAPSTPCARPSRPSKRSRSKTRR